MVCVCHHFLSPYWNSPIPPSESHGGKVRAGGKKERVHFCSLTWHFATTNTAHLSGLKIQHQKAFRVFYMCVTLCECV